MSKIIFSILITMFVITRAQDFNYKNISGSIKINNNITSDDLNKYWGDYYSAGISIIYYSGNNFEYEIGVNFASLNSKTGLKPDIKIMLIPITINYRHILPLNFSAVIKAGLVSKSFSFTNQDNLKTNTTESEFGFTLQYEIYLIKIADFNLGFNTGYNSLWTTPENTNWINYGLSIKWSPFGEN